MAEQSIEEIVVTARHRPEPFKDVPITLTTVTVDTIERLSLNDLEQVSQVVPGMFASYGGSGASSQVFLRGIGTNSTSAGFSSAVGIVVDGQHFERGRVIQQGYFDVAQIDVLKGPQALYFGKNNPAGLIIVRTQDPGDDFESLVRLGYETEAQERLLEAIVSTPLTSTLGLRLGVRLSEQEGWIENTAEPQIGVDPLGFVVPGRSGHLPERKDRLARLTLLWQPDDRLMLRLKSNYASNEDAGVASKTQLVRCFGPAGAPQLIFGVPSPNEDCRADYKASKSDMPAELLAPEPDKYGDGETFVDYASNHHSLEVLYEGDRHTLTSITGYQHYEVQSIENFSFAGDGQVPGYEETDFSQVSQEFRVQSAYSGAFNFLAGALWSSNDLFFINAARIAPLPADTVEDLSGFLRSQGSDPASADVIAAAISGETGRLFSWDKNADQDADTWSLYGEGIWDVRENLELTLGTRYTDEKKRFKFVTPFLHPLLLGPLEPANLEGTFDDDNVSWQAALSFAPTEQVSAFVAYREGFKSGGFDASFLLRPDASIDDLRFDSEEGDGFELGLRALLLRDTLQFNVTAFSFTYTDFQVQQFDAATTLFNITNAGEATTEGLETDALWRITPRMELRGAVVYNDAKYREFFGQCYPGQSVEAGCDALYETASGAFTAQDLKGRRLNYAPEWVASLGATMDGSLGGSGWSYSLDLDARYSDCYGLSLYQPEAIQGSHTIWDAAWRVYSPSNRWMLALIGRNLTNEVVSVFALDRTLTGGASGYPETDPRLGPRSDFYARLQRGRQFWVELRYGFPG